MFLLYYLANHFPVAIHLKDSPMFAITQKRVPYIFRQPIFAPVRSGLSGSGKYDTHLHMAMCLLKGTHKARFTNSPVSLALHPTLVDTVSPCLFDHHLTTNLHSTNHSVNQDCLKSLFMASQIHCKFLQDGSLYYT